MDSIKKFFKLAPKPLLLLFGFLVFILMVLWFSSPEKNFNPDDYFIQNIYPELIGFTLEGLFFVTILYSLQLHNANKRKKEIKGVLYKILSILPVLITIDEKDLVVEKDGKVDIDDHFYKVMAQYTLESNSVGEQYDNLLFHRIAIGNDKVEQYLTHANKIKRKMELVFPIVSELGANHLDNWMNIYENICWLADCPEHILKGHGFPSYTHDYSNNITALVTKIMSAIDDYLKAEHK